VAVAGRRIALLVLGFALATVALDAVTPGDTTRAALLLAVLILVAAPAGGLYATRFVWRIYLSDTHRPRSFTLRLLLMICVIVTLVALYIAGFGLAFIAGVRPLPAWSIVGLALALVALEAVPVMIADAIRRRMQK
jgi:hypothetical protein